MVRHRLNFYLQRESVQFSIISIIIAIILAGAFTYVNPGLDAPMYDDFAYAWTAWNYLDTGEYVKHDWAAAMPHLQIFIGAFFTKVFGRGFVSLRIVSLLFLFGSVMFTILLSRALGNEKGPSVLAGLILACCPLVFKLSFSFMTDIPYLCCLIGSLYFYTIGLIKDKIYAVWLGSLMAGLAMLSRQFGIVLCGAVILYLLIERRKMGFHFLAAAFLIPLLLLPINFASGKTFAPSRGL